MPAVSNGLPPPLPSEVFVCELPADDVVLDDELEADAAVGLLDVSTNKVVDVVVLDGEDEDDVDIASV